MDSKQFVRLVLPLVVLAQLACDPREEPDCANGAGCWERGECHWIDGKCRPFSSDDCTQATICLDYGLCYCGADPDEEDHVTCNFGDDTSCLAACKRRKNRDCVWSGKYDSCWLGIEGDGCLTVAGTTYGTCYEVYECVSWKPQDPYTGTCEEP